MKKKYGQGIFDFAAIILIAIKIAILGMFTIAEGVDKQDSQKQKFTAETKQEKTLKDNLLPEVYGNRAPSLEKKIAYIQSNVDDFNEIYFDGRKPTLEDIDRVLRIYKTHIAEYMSTDDFSSKRMKQRVELLKEDLNYVPDRKKNLQAIKELEATADELLKVLNLDIKELKKHDKSSYNKSFVSYARLKNVTALEQAI